MSRRTAKEEQELEELIDKQIFEKFGFRYAHTLNSYERCYYSDNFPHHIFVYDLDDNDWSLKYTGKDLHGIFDYKKSINDQTNKVIDEISKVLL